MKTRVRHPIHVRHKRYVTNWILGVITAKCTGKCRHMKIKDTFVRIYMLVALRTRIIMYIQLVYIVVFFKILDNNNRKIMQYFNTSE